MSYRDVLDKLTKTAEATEGKCDMPTNDLGYKLDYSFDVENIKHFFIDYLDTYISLLAGQLMAKRDLSNVRFAAAKAYCPDTKQEVLILGGVNIDAWLPTPGYLRTLTFACLHGLVFLPGFVNELDVDMSQTLSYQVMEFDCALDSACDDIRKSGKR